MNNWILTIVLIINLKLNIIELSIRFNTIEIAFLGEKHED